MSISASVATKSCLIFLHFLWYNNIIVNREKVVSVMMTKEDFIECLSWDTRYFNSVRNSVTSFKII